MKILASELKPGRTFWSMQEGVIYFYTVKSIYPMTYDTLNILTINSSGNHGWNFIKSSHSVNVFS